MKKIIFIVPGEPTAQGRPRFSARGKFVKAYDPAKSRDYKAFVKLIAMDAMHAHNDLQPLETAVSVTIHAFVGIPKSKSQKFKNAALSGMELPLKKPDVDNMAKIILDAMSGIVYKDDKQIVSLLVEKWYAENPRVEVNITYHE